MKAIYKGKLWSIEDDNGNEIKLSPCDWTNVEMTLWVSYMEPNLIIDPTDSDLEEL